MKSGLLRVFSSVVGLIAAGLLCLGGPSAAQATPSGASFDTYSGSTPLADYSPGAVLNTRTVSYHLTGVPLPITVVQILFRTTGAQGQPTAGVTSVLEPPATPSTVKVVSYQSFYDSLNPADEPSAQIFGNQTLGGEISTAETGLIATYILAGDTVVIPDTEGQTADFAAGPEYGYTTLDSIRAVESSGATGVPASAPVALIGYSGGAIATGWAAQLAPAYAPEVNSHLVGAAEGGILVDPAHNLEYVSGSGVWAGVIPMAIIGIARAYGVDLEQYMNSYGVSLYTKLQNASIAQVLGAYPGLTWAKLVKPAYTNPDSIPAFVDTVNQLDEGSAAMPTVAMFMGQGTGGYLEGTPTGGAGIGAGDGVMIAGDVRTLARQYCASGDSVDYQQYPLSHFTSVSEWAPEAETWVTQRLAGESTPDNCSTIAVGNSLAPQQVVGASASGATTPSSATTPSTTPSSATVRTASFSSHQAGHTVEVAADLPAAAAHFSFHWELGATFGPSTTRAEIARELSVYALPSGRRSPLTVTGVTGPRGRVDFRLGGAGLSHFSFHLQVTHLWRSIRLRKLMTSEHLKTVSGVLSVRSVSGRTYTKLVRIRL